MSFKLKLLPFANSNANPKHTGPCKCVEGNTYAKLRPLLEGVHIVDWHFQFFNVGNRCRINYKLEGLNKVSLDVYVLSLVEPNLESRKCMRVLDINFV